MPSLPPLAAWKNNVRKDSTAEIALLFFFFFSLLEQMMRKRQGRDELLLTFSQYGGGYKNLHTSWQNVERRDEVNHRWRSQCSEGCPISTGQIGFECDGESGTSSELVKDNRKCAKDCGFVSVRREGRHMRVSLSWLILNKPLTHEASCSGLLPTSRSAMTSGGPSITPTHKMEWVWLIVQDWISPAWFMGTLMESGSPELET